MLNIAIIGCGKIADSHAAQISRISGARIVAACDREELMARQFAERHYVPAFYTDAAEMLEMARPDIVHITTPPQSHYALARQCIEAGAHVYVEKPFTLFTSEAEELYESGRRKGKLITVGHDDQFSHAARRLRAIINSGRLGPPPLHMESTYCYDLTEPGYATALLGDSNHWVRRLPGKLLHNVISHGIARISEWLTVERPTVIVHGFVSPMLRGLGERDIIDELRVIISDNARSTAYFTFSSQFRPSLHSFRIYGSKGGAILDEDQQTVIHLSGIRLKSYAEKFIPPISIASQYLDNTWSNVRLFGKRDFHMKAGMKFLIEAFYEAVRSGTPAPIPESEVLRTSFLMDEIFRQLNNTSLQSPPKDLH